MRGARRELLPALDRQLHKDGLRADAAVVVDVAVLLGRVDRDVDVAVLPPVGAPRVLHDPVIHALRAAPVAGHNDHVVQGVGRGLALGAVEDPLLVEVQVLGLGVQRHRHRPVEQQRLLQQVGVAARVDLHPLLELHRGLGGVVHAALVADALVRVLLLCLDHGLLVGEHVVVGGVLEAAAAAFVAAAVVAVEHAVQQRLLAEQLLAAGLARVGGFDRRDGAKRPARAAGRLVLHGRVQDGAAVVERGRQQVEGLLLGVVPRAREGERPELRALGLPAPQGGHLMREHVGKVVHLQAEALGGVVPAADHLVVLRKLRHAGVELRLVGVVAASLGRKRMVGGGCAVQQRRRRLHAIA
mmetsp:Transcript_7778/g.19993  ORF Transcript_7778/g.19993 Transcript_7778/m.19993 type:complete len:356 (-) Transcript_7778:450-1517(-)